MEGHLSLKFPGTIKPLEELNFPEIDFTIENVVTQRIVRSIKRWHSSSVAAGSAAQPWLVRKKSFQTWEVPQAERRPRQCQPLPESPLSFCHCILSLFRNWFICKSFFIINAMQWEGVLKSDDVEIPPAWQAQSGVVTHYSEWHGQMQDKNSTTTTMEAQAGHGWGGLWEWKSLSIADLGPGSQVLQEDVPADQGPGGTLWVRGPPGDKRGAAQDGNSLLQGGHHLPPGRQVLPWLRRSLWFPGGRGLLGISRQGGGHGHRDKRVLLLQRHHGLCRLSGRFFLQTPGVRVPGGEGCPQYEESDILAEVYERDNIPGEWGKSGKEKREKRKNHFLYFRLFLKSSTFLHPQAHLNRTKVPWRWGLFALDWRFPRGLDWIYDKMDGLWLDSVLGSEEEAATFFSRWEKGVRDSVPKDRLLVFQAKEGWEPLCQFLDKEVPTSPYPRLNNSAQFRSGYIRHRLVTIVAGAVILLAVTGLSLLLAVLLSTWPSSECIGTGWVHLRRIFSILLFKLPVSGSGNISQKSSSCRIFLLMF